MSMTAEEARKRSEQICSDNTEMCLKAIKIIDDMISEATSRGELSIDCILNDLTSTDIRYLVNYYDNLGYIAFYDGELHIVWGGLCEVS